jgi:hypothetical protein
MLGGNLGRFEKVQEATSLDEHVFGWGSGQNWISGTLRDKGGAIMNDAKVKLSDQVGTKRQGLPPQRQTIHYTELPEDASESPIAREWNLYRREVGRLLAEGHEGKWLLVKGDAIIGIFDTEDEARAIALQKYLMEPCLIQQVRSREPLVRMSMRFWGCRS